MAVKSCIECKGKVSDKAIICPHCGFILNKNLKSILLPGINRLDNQKASTETGVPLPGTEMRSQQRFAVKMKVKINDAATMLANISKNGMKLASTNPPHGSEIDITMDTGEKSFKMKGTICWVSGKPSFANLLDIGLAISDPPPEYYEFVDKLLDNK
jgi:hypothetical protein